MNIGNKSKIQMTEGPLLGKVLLFVLPLMLTNLLQVFYNAADMIIVSMSPEPDAVGAIGTTGAMINLIINVFIGFSVGANVMVARHIGAGNEKKTSDTVHTALAMSVLFGFVGCVIGLLVSRPALAMMGNTGKLLELSALYTTIYFAGVPFLSVTNYAIAILRAEGDTRTPLYVLTGTGILNVGLNLFFVLVLRMSVDGVAIATVISSAVSMVLLVARLMRERSACRFSFRKLRVHRSAFREILVIGLPAGLQGALFSLSNMLIQSSIIRVNGTVCPPDAAYQPVVKANAAAANVEGFAYTATNSVHQASVTFTSQNVGADKPERVGLVMRCCYFTTFCVAVLSTGIIAALRVPLLGFYGIAAGAAGSLEQIAWDAAMARIRFTFIPYFMLAFMEVGSGVLRGLGRSTTSTVVSLAGICVFRVAWIFTIFEWFPTLDMIYLSYPISWSVTAAVHFICSTVVRQRMIREKHDRLAVPPESVRS